MNNRMNIWIKLKKYVKITKLKTEEFVKMIIKRNIQVQAHLKNPLLFTVLL